MTCPPPYSNAPGWIWEVSSDPRPVEDLHKLAWLLSGRRLLVAAFSTLATGSLFALVRRTHGGAMAAVVLVVVLNVWMAH